MKWEASNLFQLQISERLFFQRYKAVWRAGDRRKINAGRAPDAM
jgi:hypothetical protein